MLIRVFRATVHEGQQDAFEKFFKETALPEIRRQDGLVAVTVGLPHDPTPREFLMITVWRDLESLQGFTGENWREAVIHPDEEHLVEEARVEHYHGYQP